MTLEIWQKLFK